MCIRQKKYRCTELGREARCSRCGEFWPCDSEFFFMRADVPHSWCKACYDADPKIKARRKRWMDSVRKGPVRPTLNAAVVELQQALAGWSKSRRETVRMDQSSSAWMQRPSTAQLQPQNEGGRR